MKWEYLVTVLSSDPFDDEREMDDYGREGWELVAVTPAGARRASVAYFKRPLADEPAPTPPAPTPPAPAATQATPTTAPLTDPDVIYARSEAEGGARS